MPEEETITVNRSTYSKLLGSLVVVLVVASFGFGYIFGGMSNAGITGQVAAPSGGSAGAGNAAPSEPSAPSGPDSISLSGEPVIGNSNAPVRFIEFSDFQCPFCRRHYTESHPLIMSNYVDTGKVLYAYKDFGLSFHEGAEPYALAANCALEQGKWEEMHNMIFDEQNMVSTGSTVPYLGDDAAKQWAADIGLNTAQFNSCFDSRKYKSEIDADFSEGVAAGVSGTPSFLIGNDDIGYRLVVGAQPYSTLRQAIEQQLAAA